MYATINFKTKKAFIAAVKASQAGTGPVVVVFQPGGMFPGTSDGTCCVEGPHYPEPHRWYARAVVKAYVVQSAS